MTKEYDTAVLKVTKQLIENKKLTDTDAKEKAIMICTEEFAKLKKEKIVKYDEDGHIIVAENVKLIIGANIKEIIEVKDE